MVYDDPQPERVFTTANEIHIPVGRPIVLTLRSPDVIHSFWVPNLHGKRDLIPGQTVTFTLRADSAGVYRGQCAEFCGYQHARMGLLVIAEPPEAYEHLLLDCMLGDSTLFTRADEVELAWQYLMPLFDSWSSDNSSPLATYESGTWGPAKSDALLSKDGRKWRRL